MNGASAYHTEQLQQLAQHPPTSIQQLVEHYARVKQDMYGEEDEDEEEEEEEEEDED